MQAKAAESSIAPLVEEIIGALGEDPKREGLVRTPDRKVHVAYLPKERVIGLSKIPRIVDMFARRLQIQERMTQEIAQTIQEVVDPVGVGVICEARHFCMMMRGVEKQHSGAMTSAMLGAFRDRKETRDEFLALVNHRSD